MNTPNAWVALAVAALTLVTALLAAAEGMPALPETPEAWRAAARSGLEALRAIIEADTPIAMDGENPRMRAWVRRGYREARARTARVMDQFGHFYALAAYVNGFRDPYIDLKPAVAPPFARWPGFIATRSGDGAAAYYRDEADAEAPALGARIVSCDGKSLTALEERVAFGFRLNPYLAANRRSAAPRLFLDRGNVFAPPPRRCVVEHGGARRTLPLNWRPLPEGANVADALSSAAKGERARVPRTPGPFPRHRIGAMAGLTQRKN